MDDIDNTNMDTKIKSYSEAQKRATMKYRDSHKDDYKCKQREYYLKRKESPEFKAQKKDQNRKNYLERKARLELARLSTTGELPSIIEIIDST